MKRPSRIHVYVVCLALFAAGALGFSWNRGHAFPGAWELFVLAATSFLIDTARTKLRTGDASGSLAFITRLAAGLLFGAFWGAVITIVSSTLAQIQRRNALIKSIFNVSQNVLSLLLAFEVYRLLGGLTPPTFMVSPSSVSLSVVLRELLAYFAATSVYVAVNSLSVSAAIALSSGRPIKDIWGANTLWVLRYDLGASSLALVIAWLFVYFDRAPGVLQIGFPVILILLLAVRHVYVKLHDLQHLHDELGHAYEKLELNVREQLEMMVKSIEARDPYTSGHSRRVAALSKAIATDLGLSTDLADEIENAALLHDVGKIHAEFAPLLSKEGRLTEEEWEIMKTHSAKSAELVTLFSRFRGNVLESVRWHHERWDGKGYPDGIVGDAIPMGARIIMVADTIDAMSTDRPYRRALSFEKVVSELIKYRGIQFDPALVDVTVNSVTVRRLVSDKEFLAEQTISIKSAAKKPTRPALRSQKSFWEGLRASSMGEP
jgi:HD-GYP domain-containing protein (c-di-GMP phosphodiesterase class II)